MRANVNPGTLLFRGGSFTPHGRPTIHRLSPSFEKNGRESLGRETWSARFIIGFNVGSDPTWDLDDLVKYVKKNRLAHRKAPDATFLSQRGVYRHRDGKTIVEEDGGQVIILNLDGSPPDVFAEDMLTLGEALATYFQQETVILDIQRNGVTQETWSLTPR